MSEVEQVELLPCPFCGASGLAVISGPCSWNDGGIAWNVTCHTRGCHGGIFALGVDMFETQAQAIAAWNRRAPDPDEGELLTIAWMDGSHRSTKAHRELIRNLRETGDRLAMFATHDQDCDSHMGHKVLPCNCGYTTAINAWKELGS